MFPGTPPLRREGLVGTDNEQRRGEAPATETEGRSGGRGKAARGSQNLHDERFHGDRTPDT